MSGLSLIATEERISRFGSFVPRADVVSLFGWLSALKSDQHVQVACAFFS